MFLTMGAIIMGQSGGSLVPFFACVAGWFVGEKTSDASVVHMKERFKRSVRAATQLPDATHLPAPRIVREQPML